MTTGGKTAETFLATVMFTDIVDSTKTAAALGDTKWRGTLDAHDAAVRAKLAEFGGEEIKTTGDGFVVIFDSAVKAVECAAAVVQATDEVGVAVRLGLHLGECERRPHDLHGIATHIAARITDFAHSGEILVSSTVRDLVPPSSQFQFLSRGSRALKGVPGRWRVYSVLPPASRVSEGGLSLLIVDDHPLWRQTIRSVLERSEIAATVFEAGDGHEAAVMAREKQPDVVLMDMELPQVHGVDATRAIVQENPTTKVLVLSSSDDKAQVMAAVRAGAAGYLLKTASSAEIQDGVRRVHGGELVFPPQLAAFVLAELRGGRKPAAAPDPLAQLSERERGVLALMAEGQINEAIGARLHLSPKTVEANVTAIFDKLGLSEVAGGHKRVLAVIAYLNAAAKSRENPS